MFRIIPWLLACALGLVAMQSPQSQPAASGDRPTGVSHMQPPIELGNFSVSLTVKDLAASRAFYEKLGFTVRGGDPKQNWIILQNETAIIGLFQGMFDKNMLTFNPGWDRDKNTLPTFEDVRDLQKRLKAQGISTFTATADETSTGPAYFMLTDPDGNPILVDQHVPKPAGKK
jgi:predicted lactoylglutathione lyase